MQWVSVTCNHRRNALLLRLHAVANVHLSSSNLGRVMQDGDYAECYAALELSPDCDQNQLRSAYLEMVKRYHPDSGTSPDADPEKFLQVDRAYRKLQLKFSRERWSARQGEGEYGLYYDEKKKAEEEDEKYNIKHTAPQHRQYLSFDGIGYGTPSQRQHQHQKVRAVQAAENVYRHRVSRLGTSEQEESRHLERIRRAKTKGLGIERLVEDLILESMNKGEFDNLSGQGKPLARVRETQLNPYVDFMTHRINQVLIDSGFVPEWVQLEKDIRLDIKKIQDLLKRERSFLGPFPLTSDEESNWLQFLNKVEGEEVKVLNSKINNYNLLVPSMAKQRTLFKLKIHADKVLQEGNHSQGTRAEREPDKKVGASSGGLFSLLSQLVKG